MMHARCKELVEEQIKKHNLKGWTFELNNSKKTLGMCDRINKKIFISWSYIKLNTEENIMNTILHEIAHALTPEHNHDNVWKAKCIEIGCNPSRTNKTAVIEKGKYVYECPKCGKETHNFRKIKREVACGDCCKAYNNNKYSDKYKLKLKGE